MPSDLSTSYTRYREAALNFWVALREKGADRANAETATTDRLVDESAEQGRVREFLEPMLNDADPQGQGSRRPATCSHTAEPTPAFQCLRRSSLNRAWLAPRPGCGS